MRPLLFALLVAFAAAAAAQVSFLRTIPPEAPRGTIRHVSDMIVEIDGQRARLSPGAQVRDASNLLIVPSAIPANVVVQYQVDAQGLLHRVWILTREEYQKSLLQNPPKPAASPAAQDK